MHKVMIMTALLAGLSAPAIAQSPTELHGLPGEPFGSDRGAQNTAITLETLTLRHCSGGYQPDMKFSKELFDARCAALSSASK